MPVSWKGDATILGIMIDLLQLGFNDWALSDENPDQTALRIEDRTASALVVTLPPPVSVLNVQELRKLLMITSKEGL